VLIASQRAPNNSIEPYSPPIVGKLTHPINPCEFCDNQDETLTSSDILGNRSTKALALQFLFRSPHPFPNPRRNRLVLDALQFPQRMVDWMHIPWLFIQIIINPWLRQIKYIKILPSADQFSYAKTRSIHAETMATNSIIIANLPNWAIESEKPKKGNDGEDQTLPSTFIESLRAVVQAHRNIVHWVPVRRFPPCANSGTDAP